MNTNNSTKTKNIYNLLNAVLSEIKSLRQEFSLILPQENLEDYAHPNRVKVSYEKALKKYPQTGVCLK